MQAEELVELALALITSAGDGETHSVAAAALASDGTVATGLNLFHFTGGPCAELTALANLRATTAADCVLIVAVGDKDRGVLAPCGRCRQVLLDNHPDALVLMPSDGGIRSVASLLPASYTWSAQG